MAVRNPFSIRLRYLGIARTSSGMFRVIHAHLYGRLLPFMPWWRQLLERYPHHFAGRSSWSGVHGPSNAAVWLAVHGGAAVGAGPFSADRERSMAPAPAVRPVDQPARFLGLWHGGAGADHRLRPGGRPVGPGDSAALARQGAEKTSGGVGRIPGRAVRQPLRLQAGALPI